MTDPRPRDHAVITGLGMVTPLANDAPATIAALRRAEVGVRALRFTHPRLRSSAAATCDPWDPALAVDHADARRLPRLVPMAIHAAREAIAHARLDTRDLDASRATALVLGTGGGGIDFTLEQLRDIHAGGTGSLWTVTNATHGNLAGELSIHLGLRGPSLCVSDGCASSSNAVAHARTLLLAARPAAPRAAIVVGADAHICAETLLGMESLRVISTRDRRDDPARASRPFDADRDGFILGEGAWAIVLERESDARARGAHPIARILGAGQTCDAFHRVRPDPDPAEGVRAVRIALDEAGLRPDQVGLVHYHGTGTRLNDAHETRVIRAAFGPHADRLTGHSVKGAIGHPQGAAGLAALATTVGAIAGLDGGPPFSLPTANLDTPDPECDLDYTPRSARPTDARVVLVNCLAFGAKNAALIAEVTADQPPDGRSRTPIATSG